MGKENRGFDLVEHARCVQTELTPLNQAPGTYFGKQAREVARIMLNLVK